MFGMNNFHMLERFKIVFKMKLSLCHKELCNLLFKDYLNEPRFCHGTAEHRKFTPLSYSTANSLTILSRKGEFF